MAILRLMKGVNLDNENQRDFVGSNAQASYFEGKTDKQLDDINYIRKDNTFIVDSDDVSFDDLYAYKYCAYKNKDKWWYAYIVDIQFVNNHGTRLVLETDVIQSYMFELVDPLVFIEREHTPTDEKYEHLVDEGIDIGETITNSLKTLNVSDVAETLVLISVSEVLDGTTQGDYYENTYSELVYYGFFNGDQVGIRDFIDAYETASKSDAIINIQMAPKSIVPITSSGQRVQPNTGSGGVIVMDEPTNLNGYQPRNKKLFSYPFNCIVINNSDGQEQIYKYERFTTPTIFSPYTFRYLGSFLNNVEMMLHPVDYKHRQYNVEENILMKSFPVCAWTSDVYKNWLGQNIVSNSLNVFTGVTSTVASAMVGNPIGIASGVTSVARSLGNFYERSIIPDKASGGIKNDSLYARGEKAFRIMNKCLTNEFAKIIDDYFDRYGYKVNTNKKPQRSTRLYWNYVKTIGAKFKGDIVQRDLDKINTIYNNGITFWHDDDIGNYNRINGVK